MSFICGEMLDTGETARGTGFKGLRKKLSNKG
jgi:hypothetical protein